LALISQRSLSIALVCTGGGANLITMRDPRRCAMLDAYIIDRIRRERDRERERDGGFIPLHIEIPPPPAIPPREEREEESDRGSVIIDFQV
jgi:hypothetical protein